MTTTCKDSWLNFLCYSKMIISAEDTGERYLIRFKELWQCDSRFRFTDSYVFLAANTTVENLQCDIKLAAIRTSRDFCLRSYYFRSPDVREKFSLLLNNWMLMYPKPNSYFLIVPEDMVMCTDALPKLSELMLSAPLWTHHIVWQWTFSWDKVVVASQTHRLLSHRRRRIDQCCVKYQTLNRGWELPSNPSSFLPSALSPNFLASAVFHVCEPNSVETGSQKKTHKP